MPTLSRSLRKVTPVVLFLFVSPLIACSTISSAPTSTPAAAVAAMADTAPLIPTLTPTNTSAATLIPSPTPTTVPTDTPIPTDTATIIPTDRPTLTPTRTPTSTPAATRTPFPSRTPLPEPTAVPILPLSEVPANAGAEVTIVGQIVTTASFSHGFKFTLSDGTGRVTLLMWGNVYDDCWDAPKINLGATVRATGTVGQFEGEWQVEPDFGGDVKVTAAAAPLPPTQAIGSLGDYMGQRVTATGEISRIEGTSSGVKLFVTDESGEILIFVWNNILDRIPNNQALGVPGTKVRVVGFVQEFRSNREIVPALPYDVEVLP